MNYFTLRITKEFAHKGTFFPLGVAVTVTAGLKTELTDAYPDCFQVEGGFDQPPADTMIHGDEVVTK